jgi:hypothetical protein
MGVELLDQRDVLADQFRDRGELGGGRGLDGGPVHGREGARQLAGDAEGAAVATDQRGGDDLRDVHGRGVGEAALELAQRPEVVGVGPRDGGHDQRGAAVERGEGHLPRAEAGPQVLQVGGGGVGGALDVVALVDPVAALEAVDAAGALHELPHAGGADPRADLGVEAALGEGDEQQVLGDADLLEDRAQQVLVAVHAAQPAADQRLTLGVVAEVF